MLHSKLTFNLINKICALCAVQHLFIGSLEGKVVWITGASSGIGKYLAIALAENNVKLCISARRVAELYQVKEQCLLKSTKLQSNDILVLPMDMLELNRHEEHFNRILSHFGQLDVLVNNAGRSQRALFKDIALKVDQQIFDLDVFSIINLSRIYVNHVDKTGGKGHIAITSSSVGLITVPGSASYTGAKHALHVIGSKYLHVNIAVYLTRILMFNFRRAILKH